MMAPCNLRHTDNSSDGLPVADECINDPKQQLDYLGSAISLKLLFNEEIFDPSRFDEAKITRQSRIVNKQMSPARPSYQTIEFENSELEDDTALLQFG